MRMLFITVLCCSAWGQTYTISTFAGGGLPVNVPATSASLGPDVPQYIAADRAGNLFFVVHSAVLRLDAVTGISTLVAGNGVPGFSGDNGPATSAQVGGPRGLAVDSAGNVYIADAGDNRLRKFAPAAPSTRSRPRSPRPLRGGLLDTVRPVVILPAITLPVKRPVLMLSLMGAAGLQLCRPLRSLTPVLPPR